MRTPLAAAALAAAALAAVPAPASAARTERFVAFFKLTQRTTWEEPTYDGPIENSCDRTYFERHGSETATLRSKPLRVRAIRLPGGGMALSYGSLRKPRRGWRRAATSTAPTCTSPT